MSFKTNVISAALFTAISSVSMVATAAPSADVLLQGIITNTTCDVTANSGLATLNVGVYKASDFTPNTQLGSVTLPITLENCADESGELLIQGTAAATNSQLFVADAADTVGFMIQDSNNAQMAIDGTVAFSVTSAGPNEYSFNVGMGTTDAVPAAGSYQAPITIAYIVN
ncbi:fimbrial protein [Serratia microhaemolytica]|uniref:fimbrial protein n=1 Tax=Serratia microhaemolytica TaxID=2675110 RepID=UPI0012D79AF6|nr:fimbrial protein [Serratia microhaemolytica]